MQEDWSDPGNSGNQERDNIQRRSQPEGSLILRKNQPKNHLHFFALGFQYQWNSFPHSVYTHRRENSVNNLARR
jgi:hypothetical protein